MNKKGTRIGEILRGATLVFATLTMGLITGVFYAFSVSVMPGLAELSDEDFVAAFQAMDAAIYNPLFFVSFIGALLFPLVALVVHLPARRSGRFRLISLACLLYLAGGFFVTGLVSVPLNESLASVSASASPEELAAARTAFEGPWNFWNDVRGIFSTLAFLALIGACLMRDRLTGRA